MNVHVYCMFNDLNCKTNIFTLHRDTCTPCDNLYMPFVRSLTNWQLINKSGSLYTVNENVHFTVLVHGCSGVTFMFVIRLQSLLQCCISHCYLRHVNVIVLNLRHLKIETTLIDYCTKTCFALCLY